nr:MAG TPA_asm: hypothetical protein [Caudoviricetes sp.]
MAEYKICFRVAGTFGAQIRFEAKPGYPMRTLRRPLTKTNWRS